MPSSENTTAGKRGFPEIADLLVRIIDLQDPTAERHASGVASLTVKLGQRIRLDSMTLKSLEIAGMLHDVGKLAMSESVLHKPARLTRAEYLMVQQHTVLGYRLLEPLRIDRVLAGAILSHHENYDGSGYPEGLKGDAIPLVARVIRIADYYDALTTYRSYRVKSIYSQAEALTVLRDNQECFDLALLDVFTQMVSEGG